MLHFSGNILFTVLFIWVTTHFRPNYRECNQFCSLKYGKAGNLQFISTGLRMDEIKYFARGSRNDMLKKYILAFNCFKWLYQLSLYRKLHLIVFDTTLYFHSHTDKLKINFLVKYIFYARVVKKERELKLISKVDSFNLIEWVENILRDGQHITDEVRGVERVRGIGDTLDLYYNPAFVWHT